MKKEKGITLIALIITIILLLILVGVSINLLIKGDLFGSAEKAVKGTNAKVEEQQSRVDELMEKLNDVENKNSGNTIQEVHNWIRTGDNLTCKHCNITLTIGQELDYKDNGKGTSSISAEKASGYTGEETVGILNNGIKLASLNSNTTLKIALTNLSVPTTTQTISKDSNTKWVVLGAEDSDKNGTNETLLLTTETPTTEQIIFYGAAGYNNAVEEINRMCKELYGEDARGMTIEDVNRALGYTPAGGEYHLNGTYNTTGNLTTKLKDLGDMWTAIKNNNDTNYSGKYYDPSHAEGISDNGAVLGEYKLNGYSYIIDSTTGGIPVIPDSTTTATKNVIIGTNNSYEYWLASRGVDANSNYANFGIGKVVQGEACSGDDLFCSYGESSVDSLSLRAVVSLRSDIPAVVE